MSDKKRKLMSDWQCPVCFNSVEEGAVPAVMKCVTVAHVVCLRCADCLNPRQCPTCRAPFVKALPIACFVDKDDAEVEAELKRHKQIPVTAEEKLRDMSIADELLRQRAEFALSMIRTALVDMTRTGMLVGLTSRSSVPVFDEQNVTLRMKDCARIMGLRRRSTRFDLDQRLFDITVETLKIVAPLVADVARVEPLRCRETVPARYMRMKITKLS